MAITIVDSPAGYTSMHDDLWFVASSDNSATSNFKYVFEVAINNIVVATNKIFPSPTGSYGIFNASPIVRSFVTNYFEPSGDSILVASNDKIKIPYEVRIGEEVNDVTTTNLINTSLDAYNFYPPLFADILAVKNNVPLVLSDYYDNLLIENFSDDFLTERDLFNVSMEFGDNFYISYFRKTAGAYTAKLEIVESNGSLTLFTQAITLTGEFNLFNLQAARINEFFGTSINENTYGYNFYISLGSGNSRKVMVRNKCYPKYQQFNIHFLNRLGGWDTMKFALVNRRSSQFQRSTYRRNDWQLVGSQMINVDSYNRYNETALNYAIQHRDAYNLKSDWVSEQDYTWLAQLSASSIAYIEVLGGYFPIIVTSNKYTYKIENADKLFNYEIDIEVSKYINSQFR